jgi:pyridoxine 5-phosphate synthase
MRELVLELDALPMLREVTAAADVDLPAAAALAELAGVDAVRLGVNRDLKPVREEDLRDLRRAARRLELRMAPSEALLGIALQTRPDRVLLAADAREGRIATAPLDLRGGGEGLVPIVKALSDAGIPVHALVTPSLDAVKQLHAQGLAGVELYTGVAIDLPSGEREQALSVLGDAARLASKLRLEIGVGGGLGYRNVPEVIVAAPTVSRIAVGRAALTRAMLVGLDRALRDLRARFA